MIKNFFLVIFAVVLTLFAAEGLVRWVYPQNMTGSLKVLSPMGYALNPSSGNILCEQGTSLSVRYHFYSPGLRDTKINDNAKTPILVLGDSVTFGWLLPFEETYVAQLQHNLDERFGQNKYQLLNAASGNWGAAEYLGYLREFGEKTHPAYVLIFLDSDDIGRAVALNIFRLASASQHSGFEIQNNFHPFPHARIKNLLEKNDWYNFLLEHSMLFQLTRNVFVGMQANARDKEAFMQAHQHLHHPWPIFQREFDSAQQLQYAVALGNALFYQINQWCIQHHAKLIVITTGYNGFYKPHIQDPTQAFLKQAPEFFASIDVPFYDIAPQFKQVVGTKPFQLRGDGHPNAFGNRVIATLAWPWLEKQLTSRSSPIKSK